MVDDVPARVPGTTRHQVAPGREMAGDVRDEIAVSWQRSLRCGLRPDRVEASYDANFDADGRFARAAGPVADQFSDDLAGTGVAVLLADQRARLIDRRIPDVTLRARFDQLWLAPGFSLGEEHVGTNAIGTTLRQASPVAVAGGQHFAEAAGVLACAAAPIADPRTGVVLGAVGLACAAGTANPLMLPLAKRAGREIEQRLLEGTAVADGPLLAGFLRARRRAKGPLLAVNERTMHTNAAAAQLLQPADHGLLWDWASRALTDDGPPDAELRLASGLPVTARVRAVHDGGVLSGALVRFDPPAAARPQAQPPRHRATFGWDSLTDTERGVAGLIAEGLTNREAAARLYLSPHTIDYHLRQIFRKLAITSRVELTRLVVGQHDTGPLTRELTAHRRR